MTAIRVTVTDPDNGDTETQQITNDYCVVTAGTAETTHVQVHAKADGTETHIITVRGIRR